MASPAGLDGGGAGRPLLPRADPSRRPRAHPGVRAQRARRAGRRAARGRAAAARQRRHLPLVRVQHELLDGRRARLLLRQGRHRPQAERGGAARRRGALPRRDGLDPRRDRLRRPRGPDHLLEPGGRDDLRPHGRRDARPLPHRPDARALPRRAPRRRRPLHRHRRGTRDGLDRRGRGPARRRHRVPARAVARLLEPERPDVLHRRAARPVGPRAAPGVRCARPRSASPARSRARRSGSCSPPRTARCCAPTAPCAS